MNDLPRTISERRAKVRSNANAMGIDEAYLSLLVEAFYATVRSDVRLGPIFENIIGGNWDRHLDTMKRFWGSVALNTGTYHGTPVVKHQALADVVESDFDIWLRLFERTLDETAPSDEAKQYLLGKAQMIARSLRYAMFDKLQLS